MEYGFIAKGAELDLRKIILFWAHLDRLSPEDVS